MTRVELIVARAASRARNLAYRALLGQEPPPPPPAAPPPAVQARIEHIILKHCRRAAALARRLSDPGASDARRMSVVVEFTGASSWSMALEGVAALLVEAYLRRGTGDGKGVSGAL